VLTVSGCGDDDSGDSGSDSTGTPVTADQLEGMTYNSTSVTGQDMVADTTVKLAFEADTMSVNGGCNAMGGPYAVDSGKLAWSGEPHSTMMACSDELTAQDDWLRQAFSDGFEATSEDDGNTLTLTQGDVTIELDMVG
jgi:heat shock protein HslJ